MSIFPHQPAHEDEVGDELDRVIEILHDCEHHDLTAFEESFVESLRDRVVEWGQRCRISPRQWAVLEKIEEKIYR